MNAVVQQITTPQPSNAESAFALAQRQALAMCNSSLVPAAYRGKENLGNVLIAMQMANRIGADPMAVMQNLHVIQGKPSLSSSFLIATVNACGRFEPLRFEIQGDDPAKEGYRVRAYAADKKSEAVCLGTWVDWPMVKAEGWSKKPGSKWMTMPGQMFLYRAAAFWARIYAPEVSLGIHTSEEVVDVWGGSAPIPTAPTNHGNLQTLEAQLLGKEVAPQAALEHDGEIGAAEIETALNAATDRDALDAAFDLVRSAPESQRQRLADLYNVRIDSLDLQ